MRNVIQSSAMNHDQIVALIRDSIEPHRLIWADLGAGSGNFTFALDEILGFGGTIFAIDQKIEILQRRLSTSYVRSKIHPVEADLTRAVELLPDLDGIIMANALHYIEDQASLVKKLHALLKPNGALVVVEYDREDANEWIPFPVSSVSWERLALKTGFTLPQEVGRLPSIYPGREIYAALSFSLSKDPEQRETTLEN